MRVVVEKLTTLELARRACASTTGKDSSTITLARLYQCEHSPMRTQLFWIEMQDIPTFVSVHFVRHKVGVEHYVKSNREDRNGDAQASRWTPVTHCMLANAQAIVNMARKRLCHQASKQTLHVMAMIRYEMRTVDPDLSEFMMPECLYRGNVCHELKPCGKQPGVEVAK